MFDAAVALWRTAHPLLAVVNANTVYSDNEETIALGWDAYGITSSSNIDIGCIDEGATRVENFNLSSLPFCPISQFYP